MITSPVLNTFNTYPTLNNGLGINPCNVFNKSCVLGFFFLERQDLNSGPTIKSAYSCHVPLCSTEERRGPVTPAAPGDFSDHVRATRVQERQSSRCWAFMNNATSILVLEGYFSIGGAQCENTIFSNPRVTDVKTEGIVRHLHESEELKHVQGRRQYVSWKK